MPSFRQVAGDQAGPNALGILIPPGPRTLIIVRPRALAWDLVLLKPVAETGFWELGRVEAALMTRRVHRALEGCAGEGKGGTELIPLAGAAGYWVRVATGPFSWMVCGRVPGQPYRPMTFATQAEAQ